MMTEIWYKSSQVGRKQAAYMRWRHNNKGFPVSSQDIAWMDLMDMGHDFIVTHDLEQGGYVLEFSRLPGCMTQGETPEEVLRLGLDALRGWLEAAKGQGVPIPDHA